MTNLPFNPPGYSGAFGPHGKTTCIAGSTTSAAAALSIEAVCVQIYNASSGTAFVEFGTDSTCTASVGNAGTATSDYPVAPGAVIVMTPPAGATWAAVVLSTGTGNVYLTPGDGL